MRPSVAALALCVVGGCRFGFDAGAITNGDAGAADDATDANDPPPPPIVTPPATCTNGVLDADESGVDCGGLCERCDRCATSTVAGSTCYCNIEWLTSPGSPATFSAAFAAASDAAIIGGRGGHVLWWDGTRFIRGFVGNGNHEAAGGTGASDIWLAGNEVWHWDGAQWSRHTVMGNLNAEGISARATNDVWIVGTQGVVQHYDGASWTLTTPLGTLFLTGVYALGPSDVLLGGLDGTFVRYNGSTTTPVPGMAFTRIDTIVGLSPTEVYILGTGSSGQSVFRWNGTTFTDLMPNFSAIESIATDTSGTVWALGSGELAYYAGSGWTHSPMPPGFALSQSLGDAGGTELAVAGGRAFVADDGKRMTYDGVTWTTYGVTSEDIVGLWGDAAEFHAMTASSWFHSSGATMVRDAPPGTLSRLWGLTASDTWAITQTGTAFQFDRATWNNRGAATGIAIGSSNSDVWGIASVPGGGGIARHWTGSMFSDTALPANFQANDAWAVSPTAAWAAGRLVSTSAPALAQWSGSSWSLVTPPPAAQYLTSVWATSPTDIWVVAVTLASANIWRYNGSTWTDVSTQSVTAFADDIRGGGAGVFVQAQGRLAKWNGSSWTNVSLGAGSCPSTATAQLWVGDTDVWLGGYHGMLGHYKP